MVYYCFTNTKAYPKWFLHQHDVVFYDLSGEHQEHLGRLEVSFHSVLASDVRQV